MKYLLDNKFAPLTFHWAFLEAPLDAVVSNVKRWREGYGRRLTIGRHAGKLALLLLNLNPVSSPRNRELFVSTKSPWTAYFDNSRTGGDVFSPTGYLARTFGMRGVALSATPDTLKSNRKDAKGIFGGVQIRVFVANEIGNTNRLRSIAAINDGGKWVFETYGEVQAWEQPQRYEAKRIADRFTPELLEEYCNHFGLDIFNPAFYGPNAVLIASDEPVGLTQSLVDRQKEMGLIA